MKALSDMEIWIMCVARDRGFWVDNRSRQDFRRWCGKLHSMGYLSCRRYKKPSNYTGFRTYYLTDKGEEYLRSLLRGGMND